MFQTSRLLDNKMPVTNQTCPNCNLSGWSELWKFLTRLIALQGQSYQVPTPLILTQTSFYKINI